MPNTPNSRHWDKIVKEYKSYLKIERAMSTNTIAAYITDIYKLISHIHEYHIDDTPENINRDTIQEYLYQHAKKSAKRSQSRIISGLRNFFKYLILENYRSDNPMDYFESPILNIYLPEVLNLEEIDALISAIDLSHPQGERNKAIIEMLYGCGLRVSELVNLKFSDLYFNENFIRVTGKGNKQRLIPIEQYTINCIEEYVKNTRTKLPKQHNHQDILFLNRNGRQLTRVMIFTIIKQLAVKINLSKKISPHTFRHSFATHLLHNGANLRVIQQMLGHESITTTEIYMHMDKQNLIDAINKYHPRK